MRKGFLVPHRGTLARLRRARLGVGAVKKAGIFFFGEGFASVAARVPRCEELQSFALQNSRKKQDSLASSARSALKERAEEAGFPASSLSSALRNSYPYGIPRRSAAKLLLRCFPRFRTRRLKTSVMTEAGRCNDTNRQAFFLPAGRDASGGQRDLSLWNPEMLCGEASAALLSSLPYTSVEDLRDDGSGKVGRYRPSVFFLPPAGPARPAPKDASFGILDAAAAKPESAPRRANPSYVSHM